MESQYLKKKNIPDSPGVYYFLDSQGGILYIGKATSLRDRVRSYFSGDIMEARGPIISAMVDSAKDVKFTKTDSVLEAILLEAELIKKHQPKHNVREKDDKSFNNVIITNEDYPRVLLVRNRELKEKFGKLKMKYVFGPFPSAGILKEALKILRKIFPYRDKCTPFSELPKKENARLCFDAQIGLCPGVCVGKISKKDYAKNIFGLKLMFEGRKKTLVKKLEKQMAEFARNMEFEKAEDVKRKIFTLNHIRDVSLLKRESGFESRDAGISGQTFRIEAYDISHTGGDFTVGSMAVVENGEPNKSEYRKFKIKGNHGVNDILSLREILLRRMNHPEWRMPDVVVVDGSEPQKKTAGEIFSRVKGVEIVAVVKNEKHQPEKILGNKEIVRKFSREILLANSEAHRFAISFHRKKRRNIF